MTKANPIDGRDIINFVYGHLVNRDAWTTGITGIEILKGSDQIRSSAFL